MNVKIKALAFVLMAVLLLCGCGQKSETTAAAPAQAVTASAAQSGTARPVSTGVAPEQFGAKGDGIASTKEVSGNTIRGRIRHRVFQDCSGVENNSVEVRRFSILG